MGFCTWAYSLSSANPRPFHHHPRSQQAAPLHWSDFLHALEVSCLLCSRPLWWECLSSLRLYTSGHPFWSQFFPWVGGSSSPLLLYSVKPVPFPSFPSCLLPWKSLHKVQRGLSFSDALSLVLRDAHKPFLCCL